jgi:hypothetical protein
MMRLSSREGRFDCQPATSHTAAAMFILLAPLQDLNSAKDQSSTMTLSNLLNYGCGARSTTMLFFTGLGREASLRHQRFLKARRPH